MVMSCKLEYTEMSLASYKTVLRVSDESRTVNGREFHSDGPETLKLLCPYLEVYAYRTFYSFVLKQVND